MSELNEEMLERLRGAWDGYKFHIVIGSLMALSAVAGLSYQSISSDRARAAAGDALFAAMRAAEEGDSAAAENALARIDADEFPQLRGLALAAMAAAGGENPAEKLAEAAKDESDSGLKMLFVLRRAEILINSGDSDSAIALLTENEEDAATEMKMLFAERRGDAHYVANRPREARAAYSQAASLAADSLPSHLPAINLKIGAAVSLPPSSESRSDKNAP